MLSVLSLRYFRAALAVFCLAFVAGPLSLTAQDLRFAPVLYNVSAVTGTSNLNNQLNNPQAIATDARGNLYIADTGHRVIRKVDPTQTATIFAGNGGFGYTGDNGLAVSASFNSPSALAVDPAGNVYVSDTYNFAVRRISTAGVITTVAGGNGAGSSGDGGPATAAQIQPGSLAADALGNLYIVDSTSATVRMVNPLGMISTVVGGGTVAGTAADGGAATAAQLSSPSSLAVDTAGNLYVGDNGTFTVRKVNASGIISTFAGTTYGYSGDGGLATSAQIGYPYGLGIDPDGNVYIADYLSLRVRVVNPSGIISTFAGTGSSSSPVLDGQPADQVRFSYPSAVAPDNNGNVFVLVTATNAVYRVELHPERFPQTKVGASSVPHRIVLENAGSNVVTLSSFTLSVDFHLSSNFLPQAQPCQQTTTLFSGFSNYCTFDVVFQPTAEGIRSFPLTVNSNGSPSPLVDTLTSTGLGSALALTSGQMYIVAGTHGDVSIPPFSGPAKSIGLNQVNGIAVDNSGNLFFTEYPFCQIYRVDGMTGNTTLFAGTNPTNCNGFTSVVGGDEGPATSATLSGVGPLAFDHSGNLFVSDNWDGRVRRIDSNGFIHAFAGKDAGSGTNPGGGYSGDGGNATDAELKAPSSIAFDSAGNAFIADTGNNVIRKVSTSGIITTVAGNQALGAGFSGDGGTATAAQLNSPYGVAVDAAGNIYIADTYNDVIRKVTASTGLISTIAGLHGVQAYSGDGGAAVASRLYLPWGLAMDAAGDLYISDSYNMVVRKIDTNGIITTVAGNNLYYDGYNGDGWPATETELAFPNYLALNSSGHLFVSDAGNQVIREMSPNGSLIFGPQALNTMSPSQIITISNIGNMPLHFDSQNPSAITGDFSVAGGSCDFGATLVVGASCTVDISFKPTVSGARYGVFGFYDDGVASPQYVSLYGMGVTAQPQTIDFTPLTDKVYGSGAITLSATASSGLPVTFDLVSGPAIVNGSTVTITGVGPVVIAARQAGNSSWLPAGAVTRGFNVTKAPLTVTAQNAYSYTGSALASLTWTVGGFVYGETSSVVSGAPSLSTTATPSSAAGNYPISITAGTLSAANYTFNLVPGTYTLTKAPVVTPQAPTIALTVTSYCLAVIDHGGYTVSVTIKNTGTATAPNVVLSFVRIGAAFGNPPYLSYGDIPPGGSVTKTVGFPQTIGGAGQVVIQTINGTYSGGTFGSTSHVTLP